MGVTNFCRGADPDGNPIKNPPPPIPVCMCICYTMLYYAVCYMLIYDIYIFAY